MTIDETGETQETPQETPVVEETPQAEPQSSPDQSGRPVLVYDTDLASKDAEIKRLTEEFQAAKSERHLTQGEINAAREALNRAVLEREQIVSEKEAELKRVENQLREVSEATQTALTEKEKLLADYEAAVAKNVKLEVISAEFPDLIGYAKWIQPNKDPEAVRAACRELQATRQADLEAARMNAVTTNPVTTLTSQPARQEPGLETSQDIRAYLTSAKDDPKEYERRRQMLLDRIAASAQRAQQG